MWQRMHDHEQVAFLLDGQHICNNSKEITKSGLSDDM